MIEKQFKKYLIYPIIILVIFSFLIGLIVGQQKATDDFRKKESIERSKNNGNLLFGILGIKNDEKSLKDEGVDFDLFWEVWNSIKKDYLNKKNISDKQLFYGSLKGMVASLEDPYSVFLEPEKAKEFYQDLQGDFEGIGAELGIKKNILTVIAPLSDYPAEKAGIKAGDQIYKIDNLDTTNMILEEAVNKIRGKNGTQVVLTIKRNDFLEFKEITITRAKIHIQSVKLEPIENHKEIAYLKIRQFNENIKSEFREAINKILSQEEKPKGIIIDLRNNPGGLLDASVDIANYWLPRDIVVVKEKFDGQEKEYKTLDNPILDKFQTIILINQGSASASEIFAGALQDYKKATIVGERTFGKGCVQKVEDLRGGSMLKLTIADWLTPLGRRINDKGIDPDIKIEMTPKDYEQDKDPQMEKAIELIDDKIKNK
ncbi:S41 family peptidase [Candidatus Kuenenbacteria bacterium]|nr:S41 family peptidase [Candidatus Kuenenbacteria bacterium]